MDKTRRLCRLFAGDGKSFVVAMDHGTNAGPVPGLERPGPAVERVIQGGADAIIANLGFARSFAKELSRAGLIFRLDLPPTAAGTGHDSRLIYDVELALKLGADAVIVNAGPGEGEKESLGAVAAVVRAAEGTGMPIIGEVVPGGFDADPKFRTLENLVLGARIVSELGVDLLKIGYKPGFERVIEASYVPVLVLGGARADDPAGFLSSIKAALDAGASGVAIGRNVWGAPDPLRMSRALAKLIHGGAGVEQALAELGGAS